MVNPFKGKGDDQVESHSNHFHACAVVPQITMEMGV
jgi:hypothetical protein